MLPIICLGHNRKDTKISCRPKRIHANNIIVTDIYIKILLYILTVLACFRMHVPYNGYWQPERTLLITGIPPSASAADVQKCLSFDFDSYIDMMPVE